MADMNLALIAKLRWSFYAKPHSPWVQALKYKYIGLQNLHLAPHKPISSWGFGKLFGRLESCLLKGCVGNTQEWC